METPHSPRLVEQNLPQQFIYDLGLYLQTCAQIEVNVCGLIVEAEANLKKHEADSTRFHELRKLPIKELIKQLRALSSKLEGDISEHIAMTETWISEYKENRHIAAHGAFIFEEGEENYLRVMYTHKRKENGKWIYFPEETFVTRELVNELISDADRLLKTIVNLTAALREGRFTKSEINLTQGI